VTASDLRGDVVLVEYWTYLCYNCKNVQPWVLAVHAKYASRGLRVIGIHTPEFNEERKVANVSHYLEENGITWPIGIDNAYRVWNRYNTTNAWPAFFVYDRRGHLLFDAAGENVVGAVEAAIRQGLADTTGQRGVATPGVRIESQRNAGALRLTLTPLPGFKLVRSPANEVWLDGRSDAPVTLIGEPFVEAPGAEVSYYHDAATALVPLPPGAGPDTPIRGHLVYRYCSEADRVCLRRSIPFEG
jgi:thiol-disulfide isomerase/thioredoxin